MHFYLAGKSRPGCPWTQFLPTDSSHFCLLREFIRVLSNGWLGWKWMMMALPLFQTQSPSHGRPLDGIADWKSVCRKANESCLSTVSHLIIALLMRLKLNSVIRCLGIIKRNTPFTVPVICKFYHHRFPLGMRFVCANIVEEEEQIPTESLSPLCFGGVRRKTVPQ